MAEHGTAEPPVEDKEEVKLLRATPGFATWIEAYRVPDADALNAQLVEEIAKVRGDDKGMQSSNQLGWHSQRDFFNFETEPFQTLQDHIRTAMHSAIRRYWAEFDPDSHPTTWEGWINVNGPGAFNAPHDHILYHLSGCYYVSTPLADDKSSGVLQFLNPVGSLDPQGFLGRRMYKKRLQMSPSAGDLVIFPSFLWHWVYPNHASEDRISIAFNCSVKVGVED